MLTGISQSQISYMKSESSLSDFYQRQDALGIPSQTENQTEQLSQDLNCEPKN